MQAGVNQMVEFELGFVCHESEILESRYANWPLQLPSFHFCAAAVADWMTTYVQNILHTC
jgi:hypothetical protein